MAENSFDEPPYTLTIEQGTIKVYWTNLTDKNVEFILPTRNMDRDLLVVPTGVSCICFCSVGPLAVPYYIRTGTMELYATSHETVLTKIAKAGPSKQVLYVHITSKRYPPSLLSLTLTKVRENLSKISKLDPVHLTEACLPRSVIEQLCNVNRHLISESFARNNFFTCVCKTSDAFFWSQWIFDMSLTGETYEERRRLWVLFRSKRYYDIISKAY
jgi:hypothetical protein